VVFLFAVKKSGEMVTLHGGVNTSRCHGAYLKRGRGPFMHQ